MINKILESIAANNNSKSNNKYKSAYDVPNDERCDECAYYNTTTCTGMNCFFGISEKLRSDF